jgi:PTS system nitrogen regulatory IIA component
MAAQAAGNQARDTIRLGELLAPDSVIADLRARDKRGLIDGLANRAVKQLGVAAPAIAGPLIEREEMGSTGLGRGFALPHARVSGLDRCFGMFARFARPVEYQAIDELPVDLVFLLLIPPGAGTAHVAALAAISRRMRDPGLPDRLRRSDTGELYRLIVGQD